MRKYRDMVVESLEQVLQGSVTTRNDFISLALAGETVLALPEYDRVGLDEVVKRYEEKLRECAELSLSLDEVRFELDEAYEELQRIEFDLRSTRLLLIAVEKLNS